MFFTFCFVGAHQLFVGAHQKLLEERKNLIELETAALKSGERDLLISWATRLAQVDERISKLGNVSSVVTVTTGKGHTILQRRVE